MTANELLRMAATLGIVLEARGDQLHVQARPNVITPELRDQLAHHKAEILATLAPVTQFVYLRGGLTVPRQALELALDLEARGFRQRMNRAGDYEIEPRAGLSESDLSRIARWWLHLGAIVSYTCPEVS